jgi:isoleucyl-tRNA synthetase
LTVLTADPAVRRAVEGHVDLIGDELNVKTVVVSADEAAVVDLTCKPDFKVLGPRLGADVKAVAAGLAELDGATVTALLDGGTVTVAGHEIGADDVVVSREPRGEIVVATGRDLSVAIDTELDDALVVEGIARELVTALQRLRRDAGLDVTERIAVGWSSDDPLVRTAMTDHRDMIAGEVLAVTMAEADDGTPVDLVGHAARLTITRG